MTDEMVRGKNSGVVEAGCAGRASHFRPAGRPQCLLAAALRPVSTRDCASSRRVGRRHGQRSQWFCCSSGSTNIRFQTVE